MGETYTRLRDFALEELPDIIIPISILLVGWIVALVLAALVRRGLNRTNLDERLAESVLGEQRARRLDTSRWVGRVVYYVVLLLTILGFLQSIKLSAASEPINAMVESALRFVPLLVGAAAILFVAWLAASASRAVVRRALMRWQLDERVAAATAKEELEGEAPEASAKVIVETPPGEAEPAAARPRPLASAIADAAYWLVLLLFVPAVLGTLRLDGLLVPVQEMFGRVLGFLPNVASAMIIGVVGWLVARVVQQVAVSALQGLGTDRLSARIGVDRALGKMSLSTLIGFVAYILVLIPVAIGALNALRLEAITGPASAMLSSFFDAIPAIFAATLVVAIGYAAGRLVGGAATRLLDGIGFNKFLVEIGFSKDQVTEREPSSLVGGALVVVVLYLAALEGARLLGFNAVADLGREAAILAGHVIFGVAIFGVGLYLAKLAAGAITRSDLAQARTVGLLSRVAIIGLAGAIALRQMGLADEIIELAFGLLLGAVAIAVALAFGLGGREAASRALDDVRERLAQTAERPAESFSGGDHAADREQD